MTRVQLPRITVWVLGLAGAFLLVLALAAASLIWSIRQAALNESEAEAARFVSGAVVALNRSLLGVDVLLASLDEQLGLSLLVTDWIDADAANRLMRSAVQQNLMVRHVALLDAGARVLASSDSDGGAPRLGMPAAFVAQALAQPMSELSISAPVVNFASAERVIYLGRPIKLADGSRVLAVAEVQVSLLNAILSQGVSIHGLEITLERSDGQLLSSAPAREQLWGTRLDTPLPQGPNWGQAQRIPARLSAQPALVVAQPTLYRDVLIAASVPIAAALANWREQRNFILGVTLLFGLMILASAGLVLWYLEHLAQARRAIASSKAEIEQLAFFDPLTNLPNRRLLMDRLQHALSTSARSGRCGALLFLDLDHFKTLNDTLGHEVGDLLLQQVAQRLKDCMREQDTVARLGGDEFVVMLEDLAEHTLEAAALARRIGLKILATLNEPYLLQAQSYRNTCSVGAALFEASTPITAAELLKQADIAMYQVKARGRNDLCFFDPQMQASITARAQLEKDLQAALVNGEFALYYQPQCLLAGGVVAAEVLIRWQHPLRGLLPPVEFIPVAEESELINQIGLWVLRTACQQLAVWQDDPRACHLHVAVNVSARQFRQPGFVAQVSSVMRETGIKPHLLKLELTESLVLDNVTDTIAKMSELKRLGVQFSMDDFGTGQSSLSYLTRLPLDQLKIDQSFVRNIDIHATDGVIVQTIIGMANNLGLGVIAEGVETPAQQEFLAANGCTLYQGYLFGRPTPLSDFEALLTPAQALP
ncbi:MAG: EAL domain-containing protein [Rhodoferax sp.]|uniref:putative bifunctional diguanylate cyclase/phosphodiesterase n=1 Tax=Rhodoferax sp. TaxID=50421 RepID=UPI00140152D4|nr:EAL domain-containing protein [Rhodoferax sp.]NDP39456.1 EAL domain-containing protein [Rhodoferax sp.]